MAFTPDYRTYPGATAASSAAVIDAGLRAYMLRVYNWLASGLVLTGIVAYGIANTELFNVFYPLVQTQTGALVRAPGILAWVAMFAPLAFVMVLSFGVNKLSTSAAQGLYWAFCAAMGASLTSIFITYTHDSIARVFFIWGYVTRTDLTKFGSFLIMGLFGIIIASLVNMFLGSSGLQFVISIAGVLVFTGLTAYDTQRIKADYIQVGSSYGPEAAAKRSVYDSLQLFLNFINLFLMLLSLFGNRSSNN